MRDLLREAIDEATLGATQTVDDMLDFWHGPREARPGRPGQVREGRGSEALATWQLDLLNRRAAVVDLWRR
jgi:hypothetical protein